MRTIRAVREEDFQAICDLVTSPQELFMVYPRGSYPWTVEQLRQLATERHELSVTVQDGKVVAFANLYDLEPGNHAFIGNAVVDVGMRGKGLGREMVRHMLRIAQTRYALPEIRISVFSHNEKALLLYSKLGFIPYGLEERTAPAGARSALLHLARNLAPIRNKGGTRQRLEQIRNYVQLTETIGTSGQPEAQQFADIAAEGYELVINLAMPDSDDAIANEGSLVASQGMSYVHIPVPFDNPTVDQLRVFIRTMDAFQGGKVWVHCVMNYRVSAFMYHYLRIRQSLSEAQARSNMFHLWQPDRVWQAFLNIELGGIDL